MLTITKSAGSEKCDAYGSVPATVQPGTPVVMRSQHAFVARCRRDVLVNQTWSGLKSGFAMLAPVEHILFVQMYRTTTPGLAYTVTRVWSG